MIKKQILKNTFSAWLLKLCKLGTALYVVPLFIDSFGKEGYGIVILIGTILSFSTLADFGIFSGLVRFLTESRAKEDYNTFNKYLSSGYAFYLAIWLLLSVLLFVFAPNLIFLFEVPQNYSDETISILRHYGVLSLFWSFTTPLFGAITSSYNRYDLRNYRESVISLLSVFTLIIAVKYFAIGIKGWAIITLVFQMISFIIIYFIARRISFEFKVSYRLVDASRLKEILRFGLVNAVGGWSRKMKIDADPLILSSFLGPVAIPIYRAGVSMPSHAKPLIAALTGQIHTISTALYATGDKGRLEKVFEAGTKYTLLMGIPLLVVFLFFADDILQLWLGSRLTPSELGSATLCMQGMALIDFCFYLEGSSYAILYGMNRLKFMTFTDIFLGVANIIASILLVKYSGWGIASVLLPTIVIEGLARPWYLYYTARVMGYAQRHILPRIYLPVFFVLIVTLVAGWSMETVFPAHTIVNLLAGIAVVGLIWLAATWWLGLAKRDKQDILQTLKFR